MGKQETIVGEESDWISERVTAEGRGKVSEPKRPAVPIRVDNILYLKRAFCENTP